MRVYQVFAIFGSDQWQEGKYALCSRRKHTRATLEVALDVEDEKSKMIKKWTNKLAALKDRVNIMAVENFDYTQPQKCITSNEK